MQSFQQHSSNLQAGQLSAFRRSVQILKRVHPELNSDGSGIESICVLASRDACSAAALQVTYYYVRLSFKTP